MIKVVRWSTEKIDENMSLGAKKIEESAKE